MRISSVAALAAWERGRPARPVVVLCLLFLAGCSREAATPAAAPAAGAAQGSAPPAAGAAAAAGAPLTVEVVKVVEQKLERSIRLPGELLPFQAVALYPKLAGFVERVNVDRGSRVRRGQLLLRLAAPELASQRGETEAKVQALRAQRAEAEAKLASDEGTYQRLKAASATPGVVAGNDVVVAQKAVDASRARVQALESSEKAARAAAQSDRQVEDYLRVTAPFDGIITERNVHAGSLVGASGASGAAPMLRIEQVSRLRLVVAVPEVEVGSIASGERVSFTVPAFPGETFHGTIRRISHSMDAKTRTMPVELDVANPSGRLAPGMFPELAWPVRRPKPSLFVPPSAIVTTTERTFVIRARGGKAEWVNVRRGAPSGDLMEVFGALGAGDEVVRRATDELRSGAAVRPRSM